jgi:DNA-binding IclR family transcriptional regulator
VRALHADGLVPPSPNSPQSIDELLALLSQIRCGWAEASDEAIPGVGTIAVSGADTGTGETIAFCISYPASNIAVEEKNRIVSLLAAAGRRIAVRFADPFHLQFVHVVPRAAPAAA